MTQRFKPTALRLAVAAAVTGAALLSTTVHADALGQASLDVSNFQFSYDTTRVTVNPSGGAGILSDATFNSVGGVTVNGPGTSTTAVGPDAGLYTQTHYLSPAASPGNFAGGFASQSGDATPGGGGANALTDATVSIAPQLASNQNNSSGNNTLAQEFLVTVDAGVPSATFGIDFNADVFVRSYLDSGPFFTFSSGNVTSSTAWRLDVFQVVTGGQDVQIASWTPGDSFGSGITCVGALISNCSQSGTYNIGQSRTAFADGNDNQVNLTGGVFAADFDLLGGNTYRFALDHSSIVNARLQLKAIPEPGSLALAGLALLIAGAASRRTRTV